MSGPYQSERERCLARSQFSSPDARRGPAQPRPDRAGATQEAVAASPSGHSSAHRTAGPRSVRHGSGPGIAWAPSLLPCALAAGHPVMYPAGPASRTPVAVPMRPWCLWCSCAWVCCGCGPGGWPLGRSSPRSHLAWQCCSRWPGQPGWGSSPIPAGLSALVAHHPPAQAGGRRRYRSPAHQAGPVAPPACGTDGRAIRLVMQLAA